MTLRASQFCAGGLAYGLLEIFWRGYTHLSMLLIGGFCFLTLLRIAKSKACLLLKCLAGGLCITILEFLAGCVVNLWLGLAVWDYSHEPLHLLGQVCARFSLLWCLLSAIILPLCRAVPIASQKCVHAISKALAQRAAKGKDAAETASGVL